MTVKSFPAAFGGFSGAGVVVETTSAVVLKRETRVEIVATEIIGDVETVTEIAVIEEEFVIHPDFPDDREPESMTKWL